MVGRVGGCEFGKENDSLFFEKRSDQKIMEIVQRDFDRNEQ